MTNSLLSQFQPARQSETIIINTKDEIMKVQKRSGRPTYTNVTITTTDDFVNVIFEGYNENFRDCICKISKDVWNAIDQRRFSNFLIEQISINQEKCWNNPNLK